MTARRPIGIKRVNIEIEEQLHKQIKFNSLEQNKTMREWILEAIVWKLAKEKDLGY